MDNWKIALAERKDADEILKLYRTHLHGAAAWNEEYPSMDTINFDLSRDALIAMKNEKNEIIAVISIDDDEEVRNLECWSKELEPSAELSRLCVRKDMHNNGIAKIMMEYAFELLRKQGIKGVHILVKKEHIIAIKSYSHLNYKKVGECDLFDRSFNCYERQL